MAEIWGLFMGLSGEVQAVLVGGILTAIGTPAWLWLKHWMERPQPVLRIDRTVPTSKKPYKGYELVITNKGRRPAHLDAIWIAPKKFALKVRDREVSPLGQPVRVALDPLNYTWSANYTEIVARFDHGIERRIAVPKGRDLFDAPEAVLKAPTP